MKKYYAVLFVLSLLALGTLFPPSMSAQTTQMSAKEWFETSSDALMPEQVVARLSSPRGGKTGSPVAQERDEKIFVVVSSDHFVRKGRSLQTQLVAIKDWSEPLTMFGRILIPGPSGRYDEKGRVVYFNAQTGVLFGRLPRGVVTNETVELYSPKITDEFEYGEYIVEIAAIQERTGQSIQRLFSRFYVNWGGPETRWLSLDRGKLENTTNLKVLRLEGTFPLNSPLTIFFGRTGYGFESMQAQSTDGQTILLPVQFGAGRDQEVDAVVVFPSIGESWTTRVVVKADPKQ